MLNDSSSAFANHSRKYVPVFMSMGQKFVAEREQSLVKIAPACKRLALPFLQTRLQTVEAALQEILFVIVMFVKRRPAYVCPVDDLLDGDRLERLLLDQCQQ